MFARFKGDDLKGGYDWYRNSIGKNSEQFPEYKCKKSFVRNSLSLPRNPQSLKKLTDF